MLVGIDERPSAHDALVLGRWFAVRSELHMLPGGSASRGLQQLAEREDVAVIVLGSSERSGLGRIAPGKTANRRWVRRH